MRFFGSFGPPDARTAYTYSCQLTHVTQGEPGAQSVTEYCYDENQNLKGVWDANHPVASNPEPTSAYEYDELDRLTVVTVGTGTASPATTEYTYDVQDHLSSVTDAEQNRTDYTTSDRDLLTREESPVSGVTTYAYNEHGVLGTRTDARGVTLQRTLDALDRPTLEDYPGSLLDTTHVYDGDGGVPAPFRKGRLRSSTRGGSSIVYDYDRFGRLTLDGEVSFSYDKNGNALGIGYPGGVSATYSYDFADRQRTLSVTQGATTLPVVTDATYLAGGPLRSLALANGLTEQRLFDRRYFPDAIEVPGRLQWDYTTDAVGNVLEIADLASPSNDRSYAYHPSQYFLTSASGPWPGSPMAWSYDRIGNRLSETRSGVTDDYEYLLNPSGLRTAKLAAIEHAAGQATHYGYDEAGNTVQISSPDLDLALAYDGAGQLVERREGVENAGTRFGFDPRGFLAEASSDSAGCAPQAVESTYSSAGLLLQRRERSGLAGAPLTSRVSLLYFAGRPVGQLESLPAPALTLLTTDHLGTPVLAMSGSTATWSGGFEPFGEDWSGASGAGVFLRFPGQWESSVFGGENGAGYYNLHRWYMPAMGRYSSADPLGRGSFGHPFAYAESQPLTFIDPLGLFIVDSSCSPECASGRDIAAHGVIACGNIRRITIISLQRCIERKCLTARIRCDDPNGWCDRLKPAGGYAWSGQDQIFLCPWNWRYEPTMTYLADAILHEFAHTCSWFHDIRIGVPLTPLLDPLPLPGQPPRIPQ